MVGISSRHFQVTGLFPHFKSCFLLVARKTLWCMCAECMLHTSDVVTSHQQHLTKTAGKLQSRNNLLMKLAGSSWGANANTLRSSALALCYSAAEYCCPVWQRSTHISLVDAQLHSSMRLISGTVWSTPLPWLPVLTNIEPQTAATDKLITQAECHHDLPLYDDVFHPPPLRLESRKPLWRACSQLMSQVGGGKTGNRLRWSIPL